MYKPIKLLFLSILVLTVLFTACTKEQDITTIEVEVEQPQPAEVVILRGTVRDTSETGIANASLRLQLENFEKEITTDQNGIYEIEIPANQTNGLIIADKSQYNRTIQSVSLTTNLLEKDIYLLENPSASEVNLNVNTDSLFTLRGRLVNQFNQALPEIFLFGESIFDGNDEVKFSGKTELDGTFEFIEEQKDYIIHVIFASAFQSPCFDRLFQSIPHVNDTLVDVGDLVFPQSTTQNISPSIELSDCEEIDYINHIYIPGDINTFEEQLTDGQTLTFCDTSLNGAWIYNGIRSLDGNSFDGQFQNINDFASTQSFNLCTPTENFVEVRSSSGTVSDMNPTYSSSSKTVRLMDGSDSITFQWQGSFSSSAGGGSYSYSNIASFEKRDASQTIIYQLDTDNRYFVNWVNGGEGLGVLTVRVKFNNGDTELITLRFRV